MAPPWGFAVRPRRSERLLTRRYSGPRRGTGRATFPMRRDVRRLAAGSFLLAPGCRRSRWARRRLRGHADTQLAVPRKAIATPFEGVHDPDTAAYLGVVVADNGNRNVQSTMGTLGSTLRVAYDRLSSAALYRRPSEARALPVWGDGFADDALDLLWRRRDWNSIDVDELVLLIPSLMQFERTKGVGRHLRQALCARVRFVVDAMAAETPRSGEPARGDLLNAIDRSGVLAAMTAETAFKEGDLLATSWYGCNALRPEFRRAPHAAWINELAVLAGMDRLLREASRGEDTVHVPVSRLDPLMGEADVVSAVVHSSINAAYALPHLAVFHETFTLAAWLGFLVRGRRALMPRFIAELVVERLKEGGATVADDPREAVLRVHAERAIGTPQLMATAHRVLRRGDPAVVRPHPRLADVGRVFWNPPLADELARLPAPHPSFELSTC